MCSLLPSLTICPRLVLPAVKWWSPLIKKAMTDFPKSEALQESARAALERLRASGQEQDETGADSGAQDAGNSEDEEAQGGDSSEQPVEQAAEDDEQAADLDSLSTDHAQSSFAN